MTDFRLSQFSARFSRIMLVAGAVAFMAVSLPGPAAATAFEDPGTRGVGGSGGITPAENPVDGGTIAIGSTAQVVILFSNEGGRPVSSGAINMYPSSNVSPTVTLNECAQEPLAGGAQCAVAVSIKALQAGPYRVEMLMRHDGRSRLVTTTINGQVEAGSEGNERSISDVEATPDELDFETLNASRAQVKSVTLRNVTSNPITVNEVFIKASDVSGLSQDNDCGQLNSGQACVVSVLWSPRQRGPASGVLVVRHSGPTGVTTVDITGEFEPETSEEAEIFPEAVPGKGLMLSSLTEIDFEEGVNTASSITTSLVNSGDAPLTIRDISISGSDNGLNTAENGCSAGAMLDPLEACPLTIVWRPTRSGEILDDVTISHTGARGVLVLPIRGSADTAVSKDSQSIVLNNNPGFALDMSDLQDPDTPTQMENAASAPDTSFAPAPQRQTRQTRTNKAQSLDGYNITSLAADRAVITSPSGSRVIFNREPVVIAGVTWTPIIQYNGVEFRSGQDQVLMLFDRSLTSFKGSGVQSGNSRGGSNLPAATDTTN